MLKLPQQNNALVCVSLLHFKDNTITYNLLMKHKIRRLQILIHKPLVVAEAVDGRGGESGYFRQCIGSDGMRHGVFKIAQGILSLPVQQRESSHNPVVEGEPIVINAVVAVFKYKLINTVGKLKQVDFIAQRIDVLLLQIRIGNGANGVAQIIR